MMIQTQARETCSVCYGPAYYDEGAPPVLLCQGCNELQAKCTCVPEDELHGETHDDEEPAGMASSSRAWAPDDAEDLAEHIPPDVFESGMWRLLQQERQHGQVLPELKCISCGCTDAKPCPGGCIWASESPPRCSRCALQGGTAHG